MLEKLGKYRIDSTLGKGAMGVVYQAFDVDIQRTVALKTIRAELLENDEEQNVLARFKNEAQASGRLLHPNIVVVYDFGEIDNIVFLAMEFVQGTPLNSLMVAGKPMSLQDTVACMNQLLTALAYAHQRGVIHRDIKPANLLITHDIQLKITDFGIARLDQSTLTQTGAMMGTPSYMSPEQLRGETVDARSDIFAAAVVLYQLLTGQRPFTGAVSAVIQQILNEQPVKPSQLNRALNTDFDRVINKALAKHPNDRYPSAQAFLDDFNLAYQRHKQHPGGDAEDSDCTILATAKPGLMSEPAKTETSFGLGSFNTVTPWKVDILPELHSLLVKQVGPIAKVLLKNALSGTHNIDELSNNLLPHIPDEKGREQFLAGIQTIRKKLGLDSSINQTSTSFATSQTSNMPVLLAAEVIATAEQKLTMYIGPIAKIVVKKAAKQTQDKAEFLRILASNISDEKQRLQFLKEAE